MWHVENQTPFAAERAWVRDRNGAEVWLVAVKCTFEIGPDGSTRPAGDQPAVLRIPEYTGAPGNSSMRFDSDLVLTKTTTDVTIAGHAYAPGGKPTREMDVGFRVGGVQKVLRVVGDRKWRRAGMTSPEHFVKMPLVYERAFGGVDRKSTSPERDWDWRNPVGTGFAVSGDHLADVTVPNLEYPDEPIRSWNDRPRPAGFGPVSSHWQPRVAFAGTYDERWVAERLPLVPNDFDDRFFQCAPVDQQTPTFLRGGEQFTLFGVRPNGELRFVLPKVFLGFETLFYDGSTEIHKERKLHSVIIDADRPSVSLVWHTALACHFKVQKLRRTIVTLKTPLRSQSSGEDVGESESA